MVTFPAICHNGCVSGTNLYCLVTGCEQLAQSRYLAAELNLQLLSHIFNVVTVTSPELSPIYVPSCNTWFLAPIWASQNVTLIITAPFCSSHIEATLHQAMHRNTISSTVCSAAMLATNNHKNTVEMTFVLPIISRLLLLTFYTRSGPCSGCAT